jgi:hypothetical protein
VAIAEERHSYIAECFWPGVTETEVEALDARAVASAAALAESGEAVRYRGSILVREDEVVLCQFEGVLGAVRLAAERAQIPFARIVETAHSLSPSPEFRKETR